MKQLRILLVVWALQLPLAAQHQRVSLELGQVTVWLGMTKDEALSQFSKAGYKATSTDNGIVALVDDQLRGLSFRENRLVWASREWRTADRGDLEATIGALNSLIDEAGDVPCSLWKVHHVTPEETIDGAGIKCGKRSVLITKGKLKQTEYSDINEWIGDPSESK